MPQNIRPARASDPKAGTAFGSDAQTKDAIRTAIRSERPSLYAGQGLIRGRTLHYFQPVAWIRDIAIGGRKLVGAEAKGISIAVNGSSTDFVRGHVEKAGGATNHHVIGRVALLRV